MNDMIPALLAFSVSMARNLAVSGDYHVRKDAEDFLVAYDLWKFSQTPSPPEATGFDFEIDE